jgi:hypothetical protein
MRPRSAPTPTHHPDTTSPVAVWVVAALGVHLFVSSLALASSACSGTIERTRVARISAPVLQAFRDLVESSEHHTRREAPIVHDEIDVPRAIPAPSATIATRTVPLDARLMDLPPPAVA